MKIFEEIHNVPEDFEGHCLIKSSGNQYWFKKGRASHREDGPAVIWADGDEYWWCNNLIHRIGGPAGLIETEDEQEHQFWIHGFPYEEEDYWNHPLLIEFKLNNIINL